MRVEIALVLFAINLITCLPAALGTESKDVLGVRDTLVPREGWANDLLDGKCRKITLIYGRGTTATGNKDGVGDRLVSELARLEGGRSNIAYQGVDYDAAVAGYLDNGSDDGGKKVAELVRKALKTKCNTKIVLAGYSQGAQIMYKGVNALKQSEADQIKAVVLFGNPKNLEWKTFPKIASKVRIWCHEDDWICKGIRIPNGAHQGYENNCPAAAKYISTKV